MESVSNSTNLNVRVDATLKQESDMLFKDLEKIKFVINKLANGEKLEKNIIITC